MINRKNLSQIKCIVAEVDGVLTDGKTWLSPQGHKQRKFSARDSLAVRRLLKAGYSFAVVYDCESPADEKEVTQHFSQLGIKNFIKKIAGKTDFSQVFAAFNVTPEECAFMRASDFGATFEAKNKFGLEVTAANSPQEIRTSVQHVTGSEGGEGALAEFSQLVLDHGSYSSHLIARKAVNS